MHRLNASFHPLARINRYSLGFKITNLFKRGQKASYFKMFYDKESETYRNVTAQNLIKAQNDAYNKGYQYYAFRSSYTNQYVLVIIRLLRGGAILFMKRIRVSKQMNFQPNKSKTVGRICCCTYKHQL